MKRKPDISDMTPDEVEAVLVREERAGFVERQLGPNGEKRWKLTEKGRASAKHLLETSREARDFFDRLKPS